MSDVATVQVTNPTPVESQEQQAALIARADAGLNQQQPTQENKDLLAGKYKSVEDLVKGYKELESKLGQKPAATPAPTPAPAPAATTTTQPNDLTIEKPAEVKSLVEQAGIKFEELEAAVVKDGKLSEAQYESLTKAGFPKAMVDQYINGVMATRDQVVSSAAELVGGKETFNNIRQWAAANLTDAQLKAYNDAAVAGGEQYKLALTGLKAQFDKANGSEPNLIGGGKGGNSNDVFATYKELSQAIADPRYNTDAAYRRSVEEKLGRSKI